MCSVGWMILQLLSCVVDTGRLSSKLTSGWSHGSDSQVEMDKAGFSTGDIRVIPKRFESAEQKVICLISCLRYPSDPENNPTTQCCHIVSPCWPAWTPLCVWRAFARNTHLMLPQRPPTSHDFKTRRHYHGSNAVENQQLVLCPCPVF